MYAAATFIIATSLVTKPLYTFMKNDAWFAVVAGFLVNVLLYLVYAGIARKFPGESLIDINDAVYGRFFGKIVSALYVFFFFTLACFDTNVISSFIKALVLPNTPMALILFVFVFVCIYAARRGPVNLMKFSALFVYASTAVIIINSLLLLKDTDLKNFQPAFEMPLQNYIFGTYSVAMLPLCDPFALFMFAPDMRHPKEFGKAMFKGLTLGAVVLLFIVLRDITILGRVSALETYPTFSSIQQIDVGDVITRMDIIYISILLAMMFYKVSALFYASVNSIQRLMKFDSYRFLTLSFGALLMIYSLAVFGSAAEHSEWLVGGGAEYFQTFFMVLLPLLTLIVAECRGFRSAKVPAVKNES